ncbi:phosphoglycerate dehydrogenase [Flavobacteriaceae bacterium]|nr:phosphoglycerate dehydrogenase [Flavobacteriaceae bacterium]
MKILLTTTSFQDTPGPHLDLLNSKNFIIDKLRGPLSSNKLIPIIGDYDGIICGDDEINKEVISAGLKGKLKVISKYGIGLDKVDLHEIKKTKIKIYNTPGVNNEAVAEHFFSLLLSFEKNIIKENNYIQSQKWVRLIGREIFNKSIGIIGLGNVGKEIVKRAHAFGLKIHCFDKVYDSEFCKKYDVSCYKNMFDLFDKIDYLSLNLPLNSQTSNIINKDAFARFKKDIVIVNTARSGLVDEKSLINSLRENKIRGYLTDVLNKEPMIENHPLLEFDNVIITPHIGSRNHETVARQGLAAVNNLINNLK